jgi:hypothetical protein
MMSGLTQLPRNRTTPPSIVTRLDEGPSVFGFFNQLKQEFVSARFLHFEGTDDTRIAHADRDVYQYNTLDYPTYTWAAEKVKAAFRIVCSLFDKIPYLLNNYFRLGIPERKC